MLPTKLEEFPTAALMTAYFFLAMSSVSIIKSLQNALYLGRVGFDYRLPLVYVALAALSGPIVVFYRFLGRSYSHILLSGLTLLFLCMNLLTFYWLSGQGDELVYLSFYLWGGIATVLLPMLGWVISYDLYTTRQAKRLFAMLGTGGILGGVAGGFYTAAVAPTTGTEPLMYHVTVLLGLMLGVLFCIHRLNGEQLNRIADDRAPVGSPKSARLDRLTGLLKSDYFASIAVLVLMTGAVTTVIDLQYKWVLEERFSSSEVQITQFFGVLLGTAFILSAFVQFFVTNKVLRTFGVGIGLVLLPAGILGASLSIFVLAAFWVAVGLRLADGCLRSSVYRTSVELLFLPNWGKQTVGFKSFVDLVVFRTGDALGAALFLTAAIVLEFPVSLIVALVAVASVGWILLARKLQDGYLKSLRESLEIKSSPGSRAAFHMDEAVAEQTLLTALKSENPAKVQLALHQLATGRWEPDDSEDAFTLAGEDMMQSQVAPLVRARPAWLKSVAPLLNHDDRRVVASALSVISRLNGKALRKKLKSIMSSDSVPRSSYLLYLNEYVERVERYLIPAQVLKWSRQTSENKAVLLAELMGSAGHPVYKEVLETWAREGRSPRTKAAIEALGQYVDPQLTPLFVDCLRFHWSRSSARKALACYGDAVVAELAALLKSVDVEPDIKREIPQILTRINTPRSREALIAGLYLPDVTISYRALRGLNKLRAVDRLSYNQDAFLPVLQMWAKQYYDLLNISLALPDKSGQGCRLLAAAVEERMDWTIEKIFRGLALFIPRGEAYFSYLGYTSHRRELRANAVELIDLRLPGELKTTLLPIFSDDPPRQVLRTGRRLFGLPSTSAEILSEALFERDPWLKCCILAALVELRHEKVRPHIRQATNDRDPRVRETAEWVLEKWSGPVGAPP